jgi:hypothetical protein
VAQSQGFTFLSKPQKEDKDIKADYVFDFENDPEY